MSYSYDNYSIGLQSSYFFGSNAITNQFFYSIYQGQYIDSALKNTAFERLGNNNRIGGDFSYAVFCKIRKPYSGNEYLQKRKSYWIKAGARDMAGFSFSDNLFKLIFNGNSQFAGQQVDLGTSFLTSLQYQYLQFGIEKELNHLPGLDDWNNSGKNNTVTVGAGLSIIKGSDHLQMEIDKALLYTQSDGEYIDLDLNYKLKQTDSLKKDYAAFNGLGMGLDFYYRLRMKNESRLNITVNDLGFISWNNQSLQSSADTSYHFEGLEINNIFDLLDTTASDQNIQDTIVNGFMPSVRQASYTSLLPAQIHLTYWYRIKARTSTTSPTIYAIMGMKYRLNAAYFPTMYVGAAYTKYKFEVTTTLAYGGYTQFSWDMRIKEVLWKNRKISLEICAGLNNPIGYLVPKITTSQGAFLALSTHF